MMRTDNLSVSNLLCYGVLALPLAFAGMPLYIHAPDFYAVQYQVPLATLGIILLLMRAFDAIQDPLIGVLSDRYASKRFAIMAVGICLFGISFYMLFHPQQERVVAWFAVSMVLATTAFSIISINLYSLGAILSKDTHEKTRIVSYREVFGLIGLILASILPTLLQNNAEPKTAFHQLSMVFIMVLAITSIIFLWGAPKHTSSLKKEKHSNGFLKSLSKTHLMFFVIYGLSLLASAIPAVLVIFFIRDALGGDAYTGFLCAMVKYASGWFQ